MLGVDAMQEKINVVTVTNIKSLVVFCVLLFKKIWVLNKRCQINFDLVKEIGFVVKLSECNAWNLYTSCI